MPLGDRGWRTLDRVGASKLIMFESYSSDEKNFSKNNYHLHGDDETNEHTLWTKNDEDTVVIYSRRN
jgi:hypothetical protein